MTSCYRCAHPAVLHYSARYQQDLARCWADLDPIRHRDLPLTRLVRQARAAYRACWRRELLRHRER